MQRADEVFAAEREAGPDDDRFLPDTRIHAAADLPLADEQTEALVERSAELEPIEHLEELFGAELELRPLDRRGMARFCE